MNHSIIEVVFKVRAKLRFGEEIRVSGNVPVLGCGDPIRSIPLVTSSTDFPWWQTKDALFLSGDAGAVSYRYCVFSGGKFNRWETVDRRQLEKIRTDSSSLTTSDVFGQSRVLEDFHCSSSPKNVSSNVVTSSSSTAAKRFSEWSKKMLNEVTLSPQDGVIIVSYFLPVIMSKSSNGKWSAVWDSESILALSLNMRVTWLGIVRFGGAPIPTEDEDAVTRVLAEMNCHPVFINQTMHHQFYDIFCKQYLWMIMHQVIDVFGPMSQQDFGAKGQQDLWFNYSKVNIIFKDKIMEVFQQGDLVWIHGFHFMLLPSFLRRSLPSAKIGYFFHTPFPSSEIWRALSRREDLIRGILSADHIGFHLYEYARHFMSACHRIIGLSHEFNASGKLVVNCDGRDVAITCIHVGIDLPRIQAALSSPQFEADVLAWQSRCSDKVVVAGIDRLERLKGIPLKLSAIEQFMDEQPQWQGKLMFAIIGISAGERGDDYRQTLHDVQSWVAKLNSRFGSDPTQPFIYFEEHHERDVRLSARLAFFAASDIFMSTATRDGLNRFPMEFTLAKQRASQLAALTTPTEISALPGLSIKSSQGLVLMSEFISSARVMRGALTVNPWRLEEVKKALQCALEMPASERGDRVRRNLEFSTRLTTAQWANHVLHDLKTVQKNTEPSENFAVGFGMGFRVMGVKAGFQPLDLTRLSRTYKSATYRLIVLDWGGTLVAENDKSDKLTAYAVALGHATRAGPTQALKESLETLCNDSRNTVFVISGKDIDAVQDFFGDVRGLGLAAEHGVYYRWPRDEFYELGETVHHVKAKWHTVMDLGDQTWKEAAKGIMDIYVQRTHGTYIEQKGSALIWQFRDADPEFGFMQSKELEDHLKSVLPRDVVEVLRGGGVSDGYIEARRAGVSKGLFMRHALSTMKSLGKEPDFVLGVGDDASDEPMFEEISKLHGSNPSQDNQTAFGVAVGKKPTIAQSYVDDTSAVMDLLTTLNRTSLRDKRQFSALDLPLAAKENMAAFVQSTKDPKSPPVVRPPVRRATSGSNLLSATMDFNRKPQAPEVPADIPAAQMRSLLDTPEVTVALLGRSASTAHLSMANYLESIEDQEQEDDSGGIFF